MILVTRLNGPVFALNPDLVERADCTPDTVITLVDGTKYVISESVPEFIELVRHYRASVISAAQRMGNSAEPDHEPLRHESARHESARHESARHESSRQAREESLADGTAKIVQLHRRDR